MALLNDLIDFIDAELEPRRFSDYAPNGLQLPGREDVRCVVTGVSASKTLLDRAVQAGADLVLVHHGLFWKGEPLEFDRPKTARIRSLLDADTSLAAYHLPLDGHPVLGNNAQLAAALGASGSRPAFPMAGADVGVVAEWDSPVPVAELLERIAAVTDPHRAGATPISFMAGPEEVRTLGIVSGAAAAELPTAVGLGLDGFLTGEPAERSMAFAEEHAIHFVAAGHHATEVLGVQALGDLLAERFGVRHLFLDVPNPI